MLIVKDLLGNHYAIELGFENDGEHITIKGTKTITDLHFDFIN